MTSRIVRLGPLPDKHLLQVRISRASDPEIYQVLENTPLGENAPIIRELIKLGIAARSGKILSEESVRVQSIRSEPIDPSHDVAPAAIAPIAAYPPSVPLSAPPAATPSSPHIPALSPDLLRLLADEDAAS